MSDYASSLPVRTETRGDVAVRIVDDTVTSQGLTVNPDGSVNITDNGASLTVDATDLDIRDLVFATDKVDVSNSVIALDAATLAALETITVQQGTSPWVVSSTDLDIRDLTHVSDSVKVGDGTDFLAINTDGSVNTNIRDATGAAFTGLNPLPVTIAANNAGDEINDYNTFTSLAAGATNNHDYTVSVGKTLLLAQINASASAKMKIEVQIETAAASGVFNTKFVQFSSTAAPNMEITLASPISVVTGAKVRIIRSNLDNQAQNVYTTISGQEI